MRRARETAEPIAAAAGLEVSLDGRLRERMNWDASQPIAEFLADWQRSTDDRDFVPATGDSSNQAAARLIAFLADWADEPGTIAAVTHGGVTLDALRTLTGAYPAYDDGVPPGTITTLHGWQVVTA